MNNYGLKKLQPPTSRFLSRSECDELVKRVIAFSAGGGETGISLESKWAGNIRYARNRITTSGDIRDNNLILRRDIRGAAGFLWGNQIDDVGLQATVRRAERVLKMRRETGGAKFQEHFVAVSKDMDFQSLEQVQSHSDRESWAASEASRVQIAEPYANPHIFFDSTYALDAEKRTAAIEPLIAHVRAAGMVGAGYIQVSAYGRAVMDTWGRALYYPYTAAQFSVTVRDPNGIGSGWAGVDWNDWERIDAKSLSAAALDKCQRSRNPVALEPGRYTAILEPQAVHDIFRFVVSSLDRKLAEHQIGPFAGGEDRSRIGDRVFDERITFGADPMDPDLGFPPFDRLGNVFNPVTWVERGVLKELAYFRPYAIRMLGTNQGLPNSEAYRMQGGTTTIEEMISTTKRGLLVTRFSQVKLEDFASLLLTGFTRDGLWLIENGKISKPVKNFRFTESPMFVFNNVEQIGIPQRVFSPSAPAVVPSVKVRDFSFTSMSEAI